MRCRDCGQLADRTSHCQAQARVSYTSSRPIGRHPAFTLCWDCGTTPHEVHTRTRPTEDKSGRWHLCHRPLPRSLLASRNHLQGDFSVYAIVQVHDGAVLAGRLDGRNRDLALVDLAEPSLCDRGGHSGRLH